MMFFSKKRNFSEHVASFRSLHLEALEEKLALSAAPLGANVDVGDGVASGFVGPQQIPAELAIDTALISAFSDSRLVGPQKISDELQLALLASQEQNEATCSVVLDKLEARNALAVLPVETSCEGGNTANDTLSGSCSVEAAPAEFLGSVTQDCDLSSSMDVVFCAPKLETLLSKVSWEQQFEESLREKTRRLWELEGREADCEAVSCSIVDVESGELEIQELRHGSVQEQYDGENVPEEEAYVVMSGGSGGNSGSGGHVVNVYCSGGTSYFVEGDTIYISYSGLPEGCVITAFCSGSIEIDMVRSVLSNSRSSGNISVKTVDDLRQGDDKGLNIQLSVSGSVQTTLTQSSFGFIIVERPEFVSFAEQSSTTIDYNGDSFRTYVENDASVNTIVHCQGNGIYAKGGAGLRYRLVGSSSYFTIDSETGAISLLLSAREIAQASGEYSFALSIRAYESRVIDGTSGGNAWSDDASVTISIANWNIARRGENKAQSSPNDGCTIALLAQQAGLSESEFTNWLTVSPNIQVQLFEGTYKLSQDLTSSDVLATSNANIFSVPNVIYAVWCWDPARKEMMKWNENISQIGLLGFKVETFSNDAFSFALDSKSVVFESIKAYSDSKELHGIYLTGHGDQYHIDENDATSPLEYCFGFHNGNIPSSWGPTWNIYYYSSTAFQEDEPSAWAFNHALSYKLGAFIGHACYSNNEDSRALMSENGRHWGGNGLVPSSEICVFASLWGWTRDQNNSTVVGGKQGSVRTDLGIVPTTYILYPYQN